MSKDMQEEVIFYFSKLKSSGTFIYSFLSFVAPATFLYQVFPFVNKAQSMRDFLVTNEGLLTAILLYFILAFWKITESFLEIIDNKPQLKVSQDGVWTKRYGLIPWDGIKEICVHVTGESTSHSLDLFQNPQSVLHYSNVHTNTCIK